MVFSYHLSWFLWVVTVSQAVLVFDGLASFEEYLLGSL